MVITNPNRKQDLEYSTVEYNLTNATGSSVSANLFDSNQLADIPDSNGLGAYPNIFGQQIGSVTSEGIAYDNTRKYLIAGRASMTAIYDVVSDTFVTTASNTITSTKMIYISSKDKVYSVGATAQISIINPATGDEELVITVPDATAQLVDLAFSPVNNKLYVKDESFTNSLWVIDVETNTVSSEVIIAGTSKSITYSSSNNSIYIFRTNGAGSVLQLNCGTDIIVSTIVGTGKADRGIYNSENNQLYYENSTGNNISIIDVATNTVNGATVTPVGGEVSSFAYSSSTNHIWLFSFIDGSIKIIDANSNTVVNTFLTPVGWNGQIIYAEGINTVYASSGTGVIPYIQQIDASGNQFYIDGSSDYNQFILDNLVNPKKLDRIMIYAEKNSNLLNSIRVNTKESTGESCGVTRLPNTTVSSAQYQGQIGQLDFDDYILDVTASMNYTIPAFTTIKWIIYYKEYKRSDMMAGRVMIESFDVDRPDDPDTYDEKYLIDTQLTPTWEEDIEINNFIAENKK